MTKSQIIEWLLDSDPSIQYQVFRDLLDKDRPDIQARMEFEGWGVEYLRCRNPDGQWGLKFYQPKWTSSHYSLLELRNLCLPPACIPVRESIAVITEEEKGGDGGINPSGSIAESDVCINGMFLNYASWFQVDEGSLGSIVDFILSQRMPDGGFNCRSNRAGAVHSSLHTSLSVCEGIAGYRKAGYTYRLEELAAAESSAAEFILLHKLFLSDHTGELIHKNFLRLSYPGRWRYDILRALDYFQYADICWDERMRPAVDIILQKRTKDGSWKLGAKHHGKTFFDYEQAGKSSRWNTLRALRVLKYYEIN